MTEIRDPEIRRLLELAHDRSVQGRSELVAGLCDLFFGEARVRIDYDREMMADIMRSLVHDVESSVRRRLSECLAHRPDAPRDLVAALARDDIEVAYPILVNSEVLRDADLVEIIQYLTLEHQLAIAIRARLNEPVSDALVETDNVVVITTLLENRNARISEPTMGKLVQKSERDPGLRESIVRRHDLPPQVAQKLYWGVSAALRQHIVENFDIDPNDLDETIEATVGGVIEEEIGIVRLQQAPPVEPEDASDRRRLVKLLEQGEIPRFLDLFSKLSRLRMTLVRRILFEPGGEALAVACRAVGLDKESFISVYLRFRHGRFGNQQVRTQELSGALHFFEGAGPERVAAIMGRLRRDPDYLNALMLVDQARRQAGP
jgi:hypothetical protein